MTSSAASSATTSRRWAGPGRPAPSVQRIEIGELLDSDARELVSRAARAAAAWGSSDLDTEHLMWAATQLPRTAEVLRQAGVDIDRLAADLEAMAEHGPSGASCSAGSTGISCAGSRCSCSRRHGAGWPPST